MSNVYHTAIVARLATALANDCSASNAKKMNKLASMLASDKLASMLSAANVDAERFTRAIYACEKVVKFASQAVALNAKDLNDNTYAIFRTAILCYRNNVTLTRTMIEASISKDVVIDESLVAYVYRRNLIQTVETIAAQSQTSIDALLTLNVLSVDASQKNAYSVNLTDLAIALCDAFKLDYDLVESEDKSDESDAA